MFFSTLTIILLGYKAENIASYFFIGTINNLSLLFCHKKNICVLLMRIMGLLKWQNICFFSNWNIAFMYMQHFHGVVTGIA